MKYTTGQYLIDSFWFLEPLVNAAEKISLFTAKAVRKAKVFVSKIDFELLFLRVVENLHLGLLIIFLGFLVCFSLLKNTEGKYGNRISSIVTDSMSPAIPAGSLIFSKPESAYGQGEIITYIEKTPEGVDTGKVLTHRVISKASDGRLITKGDANGNPDPNLVSNAQVLGKVYRAIPYVGYVDFLLGTIPGFVVFVAIPSLIIVRDGLMTLKEK